MRAAFDLPAALFNNASAPDSAPQAARVIVEIVSQALPSDSQNPAAWDTALPRLELTLQAGSQAGLNAVSAWRDVPPAAVDITRQTVALVAAVLTDEMNPLWIRPEWLNLAPRLQRYWRYRRVQRRRLEDPDYTPSDFESEPQDKRRT